MPNRKRGQKYHPDVTQDNQDKETIETIPTNIDEEEEENLHQLPQRYPRLQISECINVPVTGILQAALNAFMGNAYLEELSHMAGRNLDPVKIEQIANGVVHLVTKETITKYKKLIADPVLRDEWRLGMCKELGRLAQGYDEEGHDDYVKGTNTCVFMNFDKIQNIPTDQVCTYARIVVDYCPQKNDKNRVRVTAGGNLINYPGKLTTITTYMTTSKLIWSLTISTHNARYICADAANFHLATPLDRPEYTEIKAKLVPKVFINTNNLLSKIYKGFIYMNNLSGMYGLPQAGILANKLLKERLKEYDFFEIPHTLGLFTHKTRPIWFTFCVDDFGVKYVGKEHADYLMSVLKEFYTMEEDWKWVLYCGISLDRNYAEGYVNISMPNYVHEQLTKDNHSPPKRQHNCPYSPEPKKYGKPAHDTTPEPDSPAVDAADNKYFQQVVGST